MEINIKDLIISEKEVRNTIQLRRVNDLLAGYYRLLADFEQKPNVADRYRQTAYAVETCNKHWIFDKYHNLRVKDKTGSMSCKNKFCPNCQKKIQTSRMQRFIPALDKAAEDYDIYHMALTSEDVYIKQKRGFYNCDIDKHLSLMINSFKNLNRYLSGNAPVAGFNPSDYGYAGALRNLEITVDGLKFHPHFHALIALKKGVQLDKHNKNKYSYDKKSNTLTLFSDFEILIQKIWRLLMTGQEVTGKNIAALPVGYSCVVNKIAPGEYAQVFKYIVKPDVEAQTELPFGFDAFAFLIPALYKKRGMQGYGLFHNLNTSDNFEEIADSVYDKLKKALNYKETPYRVYEYLEEVLCNMYTENYIYISRSKIECLLRELENDKLNISTDFTPGAAHYTEYVPPAPRTPQQIKLIEWMNDFLQNKEQ